MPSIADNQGKCCDAVLRILEEQRGTLRTHVKTDDGAVGAGVEVTCSIACDRFALEHTRIDPYNDKVADDVRTGEFMTPVVDRLNRELDLPDGAGLIVVLDVAALAKVKRNKWGAIQEVLVDWIKATAPRLSEPQAGRFTSHRDQPTGVPFPLTLQRVSRMSDKISFMRFAPSDLEIRRELRIKKAANDKLPKLAVCKRAGMTTVLVLEDDDIALSNEALIAPLLLKALDQSKHEVPDLIYLIDTAGPRWFAVCLKDHTVVWPETAPSGIDYRTFDPQFLTNILDRHGT
jgi:hypothetical protein